MKPFSTTEADLVLTGNSILRGNTRDTIYDSLVTSMGITLIVCLLILTIIFRIQGRSFVLGALTLIPIVLCVVWILGTMYLLGISLNVMTLMVTSLTIGLGIDSHHSLP